MDGIPIDSIEEVLRPPVEISEDLLEHCRETGQFGPLLLELYMEAGGLVCISSSVYVHHNEDSLKLDRNQAICAGLLVRMSKLMQSVIKLSADIEHGETVEILDRCILESAVNLMYLLKLDDDQVYDRFVRSGLLGECELYDFIQGNIESRGGKTLGIEESMLRSINDTLEQSGITVEEIDLKAGNGMVNLRERMNAIGLGPQSYTALARIPSHAIHGDWVDLVLNHLERREDGFLPDWNHLSTDGKLLAPVAALALEAAKAYLANFFNQNEAQALYDRLESVKARLLEVEFSRDDLQVADGEITRGRRSALYRRLVNGEWAELEPGERELSIQEMENLKTLYRQPDMSQTDVEELIALCGSYALQGRVPPMLQ